MKYRTKVYLSLVGIALASILLALVILGVETEKLLYQALQSRSLSIAASSAALIDPTLIEKGNQASSTTDPAYIEAQNELKRVLAANQRKDIFLSAVYTLYPDPKNPAELIYGVDTNPLLGANLPYTNSAATFILKNKLMYFTNPNFIKNEFGIWLTGYAPIFDEKGKYLCTLAVDIDASEINTKMVDLIRYAVLGLIASTLLAVFLAYYLSKKVTLSLDHLSSVVEEIEKGNLEARAHIETHDEFGKLSNRINAMAQGLRERERLKMGFARYVSAHVLDKILVSDSPLKLVGERRKVTILFSDIRQFTQLAENLPPEEVVKFLNSYFEVMIEVIFTHSGTLDKFIGDGIMAEFGAPIDDGNQEEHAIAAAIQMQKSLQGLCERWEKEGKPRIQMGIGIHTGDAVLGNIGSERRTEYTAIGDAVNVAARLEQATKILKTPILLSESTYLGAKDKFTFKDLGSMALPGRKEQIKVFTVDIYGKIP